MQLSRKEAEAIVGGRLSAPSKMPGPGFGLPATACVTGSWLHKVPNSVCSKCYALRGRYVFSNVVNAQAKRLAALSDPRWIEAMTELIALSKTDYFRWHDAGDLQSVEHLENIAAVARALPKVKFWLPTREKKFVRAFIANGDTIPPNLTVRVSGTMIDGAPPNGFANTSTVVRQGYNCPAPKQDNQCKACRRCWDKRVKNVSYKYH